MVLLDNYGKYDNECTIITYKIIIYTHGNTHILYKVCALLIGAR